jgi:hypothetical protein
MKIGSRIVIGKDNAAGASAIRKPPEDRRPKCVDPNPILVFPEAAPKHSVNLSELCHLGPERPNRKHRFVNDDA